MHGFNARRSSSAAPPGAQGEGGAVAAAALVAHANLDVIPAAAARASEVAADDVKGLMPRVTAKAGGSSAIQSGVQSIVSIKPEVSSATPASDLQLGGIT